MRVSLRCLNRLNPYPYNPGEVFGVDADEVAKYVDTGFFELAVPSLGLLPEPPPADPKGGKGSDGEPDGTKTDGAGDGEKTDGSAPDGDKQVTPPDGSGAAGGQTTPPPPPPGGQQAPPPADPKGGKGSGKPR